MLKVCTVLGTRPEIIRLSRIIPEFDRHFDHILINTGQNYNKNLNENIFKDLELREPDYNWGCANDSFGCFIGEMIKRAESSFLALKPDILFILGDTNSSLCSYVAKRLGIKIIHYEAGTRCFNTETPEEINRVLVDHLADINLTYSGFASNNLLREGLHPNNIINVGSPMGEVLTYYNNKFKIKNFDVKKDEYFLVSLHREENLKNSKIKEFVEVLEALNYKYSKKIICSVHPRLRKFLNKKSSFIDFVDPILFTEYLGLQKNAFCVLSDSGTVTEESSLLRFPAVNLRDRFERQESLEFGGVPLVGLSEKKIIDGIEFVLRKKVDFSIPPCYNEITVSRKISQILLSKSL